MVVIKPHTWIRERTNPNSTYASFILPLEEDYLDIEGEEKDEEEEDDKEKIISLIDSNIKHIIITIILRTQRNKKEEEEESKKHFTSFEDFNSFLHEICILHKFFIQNN